MKLRTLRGQLGLAYAATLLLVLVSFALITLALVDRVGRTTLDDRLQTAARAVAALVDEHNGRIAIEEKDRRQFARIVGARLDAAIIDATGSVIVSTVVQVPPAISAARRGSGTIDVDATGAILRVARVSVPPARPPLGTVAVWRDLDGVEALDRRLALTFAFAIPIVAIVGVIAGSAVAARGLRPLVALAEIASEIEAHDLSRRIAIPARDDELGRLCATFDRMLDRLQGAFARERRFTGDASHELRAPLSVIRAEADLMLRRTRTPAEYERALRSIAGQADELETLTSDLLAAARGDAEAGGGAGGRADIAAAAAAAADQLEPLARAQGVALHRALDAGANVAGDEPSLRRVVVCLLHNALAYARRNGSVVLRVRRDSQHVRLSVSDDGPGFSPEALLHATERFWRDDPARGRGDESARGTGGSGLGLAIAAAIVHEGGGTLALSNAPGGGAQVDVVFPSFI